MKNYIEFNKIEHARWVQDNGDGIHRLNYDLDKNSIVIDAGGYKGEWSEKIYNKYGCKIFIFEPIKKYFELICEKFKDNKNIYVFNYGLSDLKKELEIYHTDDASSVFWGSGKSEKIKLKSFFDFLIEKNIKQIDLMKINIEGGEYELLEDIVNKKAQTKIKNIQVQFHVFVENCAERRENIRKKLLNTHELTYDYEFIWENWKLK